MPVSPHSAPAEGSLREEGDDEVSISSASQMCSPRWEHLARTHMCMCRGGSCTPLLSQPGFLLPTQKSLSCRSRVVTPTTAPLRMCPSISLPHFPPTSTPSSYSSGLVLGRGGSSNPTFHPTLLPPRPPKIPPLCLTLHWASISFRHPLLQTQLNNPVPPRASHILPISMAPSATSSVSPIPDSPEPQDWPPAAEKGLRLGSN